jgi:hypothetical protein
MADITLDDVDITAPAPTPTSRGPLAPNDEILTIVTGSQKLTGLAPIERRAGRPDRDQIKNRVRRFIENHCRTAGESAKLAAGRYCE